MRDDLLDQDLRDLCKDVLAAAAAAQLEELHSDETKGVSDAQVADTDGQSAEASSSSSTSSGFKMMRKARDVAKDAANLSKNQARRFSLDGTRKCTGVMVSIASCILRLHCACRYRRCRGLQPL